MELRIYFDMLISSKFGSTSDICEKLIISNLIESNLNYNTDIRNSYVLITLDFKTKYKKEVIELLVEYIDNLKIDSRVFGNDPGQIQHRYRHSTLPYP